MDVIELTKKLIQFETINPPGNEEEIALFVGDLLHQHGFSIDYPVLDKNRLHVIAEKDVSPEYAPLVLTGHLDVVPLGTKKWQKQPFVAEIENGKLYGRGSSDMKGGVAAIICAAIDAIEKHPLKKGIRLVLSAGEEIGCFGLRDLFSKGYDIGEASGLIVAEPTSNVPLTGHKGGLFVNAYTKGISAHGSMPHKGENAIYKAAKAITKLEHFDFNVEKDPLMGFPTINVGTVQGGAGFNIVADSAEFTIDIRTTGKLTNEQALEMIRKELGDEVRLEPFVNLNACYTEDTCSFVQVVYDACNVKNSEKQLPAAATYVTDASVLQPWLKNVPTVILGPGEAEMAHKTDEFCYVEKIEQAKIIYDDIITNWDQLK